MIKKTEKHVKKLYHTLKKQLLEKIANWKKYKPIRGKIKDFFKLCKSGLSLKKLHKYTPESTQKTTIIIVFLPVLITTTRLQHQNSTPKAFQNLKNLKPYTIILINFYNGC